MIAENAPPSSEVTSDDDIGIHDPLPSGPDDRSNEVPRWVKVLVGDGGVPGQQIWVRCFADEAPKDRPILRADPPRPGVPDAWVVNPVAAGALVGAKKQRKKWERHRSLIGSEPLPPDAYIDQWSGLIPHNVYLQLASKQLFATVRQGHRILALWGDVQAAMKARATPVADAPLDVEEELRASMGLASKKSA